MDLNFLRLIIRFIPKRS